MAWHSSRLLIAPLEVVGHALMHELYHLLGFSHPDERQGVAMSDELMYGVRDARDRIGRVEHWRAHP